MSIFTTLAKQSMINRLSNTIHRNRSAAKISEVLSPTLNAFQSAMSSALCGANNEKRWSQFDEAKVCSLLIWAATLPLQLHLILSKSTEIFLSNILISMLATANALDDNKEPSNLCHSLTSNYKNRAPWENMRILRWEYTTTTNTNTKDKDNDKTMMTMTRRRRKRSRTTTTRRKRMKIFWISGSPKGPKEARRASS